MRQLQQSMEAIHGSRRIAASNGRPRGLRGGSISVDSDKNALRRKVLLRAFADRTVAGGPGATRRALARRWLVVASIAAMLLPVGAFAKRRPAEGRRAGLRPGDEVRPGISELSSDIIYAASKRLQYTQEAPAIVHVFSRRQIVEGGFRNLNELLATIPEVELVDTARNQYLLFRGVPFTVTALLDGVSLVNPFNNWASLQRSVPIGIVQKVEVVLSPGSVLWGAHAVFGVINVITRAPRGRSHQRVAVSGGSWRTLRAANTTSWQWGDLQLQTHFSVLTTSAPTRSVDNAPRAPGVFGVSGQTNTAGGLTANAFFALHWRGWFARTLVQLVDSWPYGIHEATGALQPKGAPSRTEQPLALVTAGYRHRLELNAWKLDLQGFGYFYHRRYGDRAVQYPASRFIPTGAVEFLRIDHEIRVGSTLEGQLRYKIWGATAGVDAFRTSVSDELEAEVTDHVDRSLLIQGNSAYTLSAYTQQELFPHPDVNLAAGVRFNIATSYAPAVLFHGHAVYEPIDGLFVKANYSEGFRPPSYQKRFVDLPTLKGSTDLDPERSRAVEGQLTYARSITELLRLDVGTGYAYSALLGLAAANPATLPPQVENLTDEYLHTISAFARVRVGRFLRLNSGYAHHIPVAPASGRARADFARDRVSLRATTRFYEPLSISVGYIYNGPRTIYDYLDPATRQPRTLDVAGYHLLSATVRYRLLNTGLTFAATLRNALAQHYDHVPPYTHISQIYRRPLPQPRTVYAFFTVAHDMDL